MSTASAEATVTATRLDNSDAWLVALHGEHDLATAPLLAQQTRRIGPACSAVIIDLSEAEFISSSVVRWLISLERQGFAISIVEGASCSCVGRALGQFGVRDLFACYPTVEDALAHAPAGGA